MKRTHFVTSVYCAILLLPLGACDQEASDPDAPTEQGSGSPFPPPQFDLNAQTTGTLFTWVDDKGAFQLSESLEEIPQAHRRQVRVVVEGHSPGGAEHVYVADLSQGIDAAVVQALGRSKWEALGKTYRDKKVAELAPPPAAPDAEPAALGVDAIVYGADWCKPCHLAEDYLKKKGARVIKKDIEEDPAASQEMRAKLKRAGMSGSSIPVLDVSGTILKGFSTGAIDAALARAKK